MVAHLTVNQARIVRLVGSNPSLPTINKNNRLRTTRERDRLWLSSIKSPEFSLNGWCLPIK